MAGRVRAGTLGTSRHPSRSEDLVMPGYPVARPLPRLRGSVRKSVLLVHILAGAAWFGIDLALGVLVFTALLTADPQVAGTSLQVLETFAVWPMFIASVLCLLSGTVLGLGSKYGLVRHWWVAVKLAVNVLMCVLIMVALRPGLGEAADTGRQLAAGNPAAEVPADLLGPVLVAPTLLLIAYLLSVFKPWGRIRTGGGERQAAAGAARRGREERSPVRA
jgi:HAMP domain-containing protein